MKVNFQKKIYIYIYTYIYVYISLSIILYYILLDIKI